MSRTGKSGDRTLAVSSLMFVVAYRFDGKFLLAEVRDHLFDGSLASKVESRVNSSVPLTYGSLNCGDAPRT